MFLLGPQLLAKHISSQAMSHRPYLTKYLGNVASESGINICHCHSGCLWLTDRTHHVYFQSTQLRDSFHCFPNTDGAIDQSLCHLFPGVPTVWLSSGPWSLDSWSSEMKWDVLHNIIWTMQSCVSIVYIAEYYFDCVKLYCISFCCLC